MKKRVVSFVLAIVLVAGLVPVIVSPSATAANNWPKTIAVTANSFRTLAIQSDGSLWAWGQNESGQLGLGDTTNRTVPVQVSTAKDWKSVSAGAVHTMAIKTDGSLWAWGYNGFGQLGLGDTTDRTVPVQVGTAKDWASVSAGDDHTMAIKADGSLWAWGYNSLLGLGDTTNRTVPAQVGTAKDWASVSAGSGYTMAIKTDGSLWAWGYNGSGQLGLGGTTDRTTPVQIDTAKDWKSVSAGISYTMAIKADGNLWAWGNNEQGQLGLGDTMNRTVPTHVGMAKDWASVSAGDVHTIAIKTNGSLWAWGNNVHGEFGNGFAVYESTVPIQVGTAKDWASVSVSYYQTMAIKADGSLWAWGNNYGQLGDGLTSNKNVPVQVGTEKDWANVSAGQIGGTTAIKTDGGLWAWGGYLLNGSLEISTVPVQIGAAKDWAIDSTASYTMLIKTDGSLWAWGDNSAGQLGLGDTTLRTAPVQVGTAKDWKSVSASDYNYFTMAIKTDGSLWAWGNNSAGQLGLGDTTNRTMPVQVGTAKDWKSVSASNTYTIAIKTDGSLWMSSGGSYSTNTLEQIGTEKDWASVSADSHAMAIKTDGSLWARGENRKGELGVGDTTNRYTFVQVGTGKDWKSVSAGFDYTMAIKADGSLWAWGSNELGQLGIGYRTDLPIQIWGPDNPDTNPSDGIDYEGVTDLIVPGSAGGFSINLTQETITSTYTIAAYSVDGGTKWTAAKPDTFTTKFANLFNKDLTLHLTDKFDTKTKKPASDAAIVTFPKINKRAVAPKLAVNYLIGADMSGATPGDWLLVSKAKGADTTVAVKDGVQIGVANAANKNKTVDAKGFGQFYAGLTNGIPVKPLTGTKVEKSVYFIRTAPQFTDATGAYTAASKPVKVTATGENKATNYKLDYKKETVKLKKGDLYSTDGGESFTEVTEAKGIVLDVSANITNNTPVIIKKNATAKKPASAAQTITPVPRAALTAAALTCANGKMTQDKKYEVYNPTSNKWGGAPKVMASGEFDIRLKPTAKLTKGVWGGNAASATGKLKITYGEYAPGKNGIVSAEIVP